MESAILGGGCFWCTEAAFKMVKGVISVTSGYAGGSIPQPTYEQVCSGGTGHAEVVKVDFDPTIISYADILRVFFATHDPTTMNRQGNDVGEQYRSIIFTTADEQTRIAAAIRDEVQATLGTTQLVTRIEPLPAFYSAEEYHQDYYAKNPDKAYCRAVIDPKLKKLRKIAAQFLK